MRDPSVLLAENTAHAKNPDVNSSAPNDMPPVEAANAAVFKLGYRPELDGLRGISILVVFIHHAYHKVLPGGFLGVDVFFVLSGFLITCLLLQEWETYQTISLRNFYVRRLFRLMPAVVLLVIMLLGYAFLFSDSATFAKTFQGSWLTLSYISNWFYAFGGVSADNPFGVTWSLAIEEQFYLIFPVLLLIGLKFKLGKRQTLYLFVFLILGVCFYRKYLFEQSAGILRLYYASDMRADGLLIGCLSAFLINWNILPAKKYDIFLIIAAVLSGLFLCFMFLTATWTDIFLYQSGGYTLIAVSAAAILVLLISSRPKAMTAALSIKPLVWLGRISYGLYLWHWAVRYFVYGKQSLPASNTHLVVMILGSFALTIFSFYCVEKPFLKLKKRFTRV